MAGENHINASYDKLHALNLDKYRKSIDTLYNHYIDECAKLGIATGLEEGSDVPFSFDNAPANIRKKYTDLMWRMRQDMESAIQNGVKKEWNLSIAKNDEMVEHLAGVTKMSKNDIGKLKVRNADALEAFQTRKNNGLGLSDRVWNITEQTKGEMEMAIELSLSKGQSASQLSRDVRQMLKEPDMMYRRFREKKQLSDGSSRWVKYWRRKVVDENGQVHWIKEPLEHTGRGVYRSSYKNAMRLARTETNMAYHQADHDYWNKCDFVLGVRIVLSNNHPVYDICDTFKSKVFPKEFDFPGWHPQCRCRAVPILAKDTEVEDYLRRLADGEDVQGNYKFSGVVDKMPEEFGTWIKDNEGRLVAMQMRGRLPYFIQNNMAEGFKFGQGYDYNVGLKWSGNMFVSDIDTGKIIDVIDDTTTAQVDVLRQDLDRYSPELQANFAELEKRIGQKRGLSMSWEDANTGKENPNYHLSQKKWIEVEKGKHTHFSWEDGRKRYYVLNKNFNEKWSGWGNNCQTCTLVHEMRRRGFNVEAIDNYRRKVWRVYDKQGVGSRMEGYRKGKWLKPDGTPVSPYYAEEWAAKKGISARSLPKHIDEYMEEMMRNDGRFEIYVDWQRGKAHVFLAEKKNGVVTFFDPQSGRVNVWDDGKGHGYKYECKPGRIGVIRIDNKMINPKLASTFVPRGELKIYADPAVLKAQRIEAAKQARLAKRTPEKERVLLEFWEKKKAEGEKRRWRERLLKRAEERHAARTQEHIIEVMEARNNDLVRYQQMQHHIDEVTKRYKKNDWFTGDTTEVKDHKVTIVRDGKKVKVNWRVQNHLYEADARAIEIEKQLDLIDKMKPTYDAMSKYKSSFGSYQANLDKAKGLVILGDEKGAQAVFDSLQGFEKAEQRYADLKAYADARRKPTAKGPTKIEKALTEAEKLLNEGKVADAEVYLADAEKTRQINEASNAAKKAQREAAKTEPKAAKKGFNQAESAEELFDMLGEERPVILQNYEKSVQRNQYVDPEYLAHKEEIERKFKDLFSNCDYAHQVRHELLDINVEYYGRRGGRYGDGLYIRDGVPTNLEVNAEGRKVLGISDWSLKGKYYDDSRREWGHWAYGKTNTRNAAIPSNEWLKDNEYYRCGTPVSKDIQKAWASTRNVSGYGDSQIILRKDRVVATFTMGNSLSSHTIPSLTIDPKVCSIDSRVFSAWREKIYRDPARVAGSNGYIELQYVPLKSKGAISPYDMERIVFPSHPEKMISEQALKRWHNYGVDIYYEDSATGKVILYKKGRPLITEAEAKKQIEEMSDVQDWLKDKKKYTNKDFDINALEVKIKNREYIDALGEIERAREIEKRANALKDLIPDVEDWHKKFSIEDLEAAHKAISDKITWMETKYAERGNPDKVIEKWFKEMQYVKDPSVFRPGTKPHSTWEIAHNAYKRKRNELIYEYRQDSIKDNIKQLQAFKTTDKEFTLKMKQLEGKVALKDWGAVEELIEAAKNDMLSLMRNEGKVVLQLGESSRIVFDAKEYTQAKKDAAKWFKDPDKKAAFKAADDYMSKYAQELWKNLSEEEKHILWLYTDGSKYINEEMLGKYRYIVKSAIDGSMRNGLADANVLTSILEKAPALKDSMWMQSGKSVEAIKGIFGVDLHRVSASDLRSLVGKEGVNNIFTSCHSAADGLFVNGIDTGINNDVVLNIFMPKGTKGAYMEPFASWGDNLRYKEGFDWTGTKRKCTPSEQVEFLLQRGAKFRITKAEYYSGKWHIDVDLIEQTSVQALDTTMKLAGRPIRLPRRPGI